MRATSPNAPLITFSSLSAVKLLRRRLPQAHLRGITRSVAFEIAAELGIKTLQRQTSRAMMFYARRRMLSHRDGCGDRSSGQSRRAPDRKRKTGPHHYAHNCALPGNDARNGHTDFRLALSKADSEAEDAQEIFGVECFQNIRV